MAVDHLLQIFLKITCSDRKINLFEQNLDGKEKEKEEEGKEEEKKINLL